jgi:hypothetical protein
MLMKLPKRPASFCHTAADKSDAEVFGIVLRHRFEIWAIS